MSAALSSARMVRVERYFTRTAQLALIYWLAKYVVLDGWRFFRAKGPVGAGKEIYLQVKNVSVV